MSACYDLIVRSTKVPTKKRPPRKNLVAIDGTLDTIDRVRISVCERGRNAEPFEWRLNHKDAVREYVDCNNPHCHDGGFSLGDVLREMVRSRQNEFIGTCFCVGLEGDPEEPGPHPSCPTRFEVDATLRFR
jgi:hypothetical protein